MVKIIRKGKSVQDHLVFDRSVALDRMEGDEELLLEMIELFLEDCPNQEASIQEALTSQDVDRLTIAAHTFKGSVGNFGAKRVYDAAHELENLAKEADFDTSQTVWSELQREIDVLKGELQQAVSRGVKEPAQ